MRMPKERLFRMFLFLIAASTLSSCLAIKGNLTQKTEPFSCENPVDSGLVYIDVNYYEYVVDRVNEPVYSKLYSENFKLELAEILDVNNMFLSYSLDPDDKSIAKYAVEMNMTETYSNIKVYTASFFSAITLGIVPTTYKTEFELEIIVHDSTGKMVHRKSYFEKLRVWNHLVFLPVIWTAFTVPKSMMQNMIWTSLKEIPFDEYQSADLFVRD